MGKRQLFILYGFVIFFLVWGIGLVDMLRSNKSLLQEEIVNIFHFTQITYSIITFWFIRKVFFHFFNTKKYGLLIVGLTAAILVFIISRYLLEEVVIRYFFNASNYSKYISWQFYFGDNFFYAILYLTLGVLLCLIENQLAIQKKQALLLQKNKEAELLFLRTQINPHFLFNTLNNIYSLVYQKSDKAPDAVLQLSNLMRYLLYEKKERVPLKKEWEYLQSFINLQQLRFEHPLNITATLQGEADSYELAPYLLIPFIENAFKHGDFKDHQPLTIQVSLQQNRFYFFIRNKIGQQKKDSSGGVGLENIRRRLHLIYPGKHILQTADNNGWFELNLYLDN